MAPPLHRYRFGAMELDLATQEFKREGTPVHLPPRVFALLCHLVEHRDRVLSKRELLAALWPGEVVTDSSLTQAIRGTRRALLDDGTEQRWVTTVRGRGYRFTGHVVREGNAHHADALLGRERELSALRTAWNESPRSSARLLLLEGEAGMGKTTLLECFLGELPGGRVAMGVRSQGSGAPPYWPWMQIMEQLAPTASSLFSDPTRAPSSSSAQFRLFQRVAQTLQTSRPGRLCLGLEDLQFWDSSSMELLRFVLHEGRVDLLLVATVRPGKDLRLGGSARSQSIVLRRLNEVEVHALVRRVDPRISDAQAERLFHRSGGNPYFALELALQTPMGTTDIPMGLRALLDQRLAGCDPGGQRVLQGLAVLGRPMTLVSLAQFLATPLNALEPNVSALLGAALVRERGGRIEVSHALLNERIMQHLSPDAKRDWNGRALRWLEQSPPEDAAILAAARLHHARGALSTEYSEVVARYALDAGALAERQHAHAEAAELVSTALEFTPRESLTHEREVTLLLRCALARFWAGDRNAGEQTLRRAWQAAERSGEPDLLARVALGRGMIMYTGRASSVDREDVRWMEHALAELGTHSHLPLRAELLAHLSMMTFWMGDVERARDHARRAQELGPVDAPELDPLRQLADHVVRMLDYDGRGFARISKVVGYTSRSGRADVELAARLLQVTEALRCGAALELDEVVAECAVLMESERHPARGGMLDAAVAQLRATLPELARTVDAYAAQLTRIDNPNAKGLVFVHRFFVERERDSLHVLREAALAGRRAHPRTIFWQVAAILTALEAGAETRGRALLSAFFRDDARHLPDAQGMPSLVLLATSAVSWLDRRMLLELRSTLIPMRAHHAVIAFPGAYVGPVTDALARLELGLGHVEPALEYARAAHASTKAFRAYRPHIECLLTLANCLRAAGKIDDANARYREAFQLADAGGFVRLRRLADLFKRAL